MPRGLFEGDEMNVNSHRISAGHQYTGDFGDPRGSALLNYRILVDLVAQ